MLFDGRKFVPTKAFVESFASALGDLDVAVDGLDVCALFFEQLVDHGMI